MIAPSDMTLDELRSALAPLLGPNAVFDGWSDEALAMAAEQIGIPPERARLVFRGGPADMIDAWFGSIDAEMLAAFPPKRLIALKIRERIRELVLFRLLHIRDEREALRRALAILAQPHNLALGARLAWRSADRIWRLAGDTATDINHYTKRTTLIGVYGSTSLVFLDDESEEFSDTRAFLNRRIDDVMRFEKVKARWRGSRERVPSVSRFLGRLRYPAI